MEPPPLVRRALAEGFAVEEPGGTLVHALAAQCRRRRVGAAGIGAVAAAWLVSGLPPGVPAFLTPEGESNRLLLAALFGADEGVSVVDELSVEAPFDLLVVRGVVAPDELLGLLVPGGTAVVLGGGELAHPALAVVEIADRATLAVRAL